MDAHDVDPAGSCPAGHGGTPAATAPEPIPVRPALPASALPGPRIPALMQMLAYWKRPTRFIDECHRRYGDRFSLNIRIPPVPLYVLSAAEDVKAMFQAPPDVLHTGRGSAVIEKYTGQTGLAWLDEDAHTQRRKLLMPSMQGAALKRIEESINAMAAEEISSWPTGTVTELHPLIHRLTLSIMGQVVFGRDVPSCWPELHGVLTRMMRFNDLPTSVLMIHKMPQRAVDALSALPPTGLRTFFRRRTRADELIARAVAERRASGHRGDDMLSVLLDIKHEDGSPLAQHELRDEMMTIFLAGTETTVVALSWAFQYLSLNDGPRDELVAEIDAGSEETYLEATAHEVLRLRPSIPQLIPREVMKPIEIGGVRYEPGNLLWASAYLLHRDPTIYPDPEAFRPERFVAEKPGAHTWIPFGGGRIRCLGARIALIEMKAVLREVMRRYDLHRTDPAPEPPRSRIVSTMPARGTRLELRERQSVGVA